MCMEIEVDIAIIGAGLAGLTAGLRLYQKNKHVGIFEARPRVGGRIHSVTIDTFNGNFSVAELGGQVLTDGGDYPFLKALIREFSLTEKSYTLNFKRRFYDGQMFHDPHALLKKWMQRRYSSPKAFQKTFQEICTTSHTLSDALNSLLGPHESLLKSILTLQCQAYEGGKIETLSVRHHGSTLYEMVKGGIASSYAEKGVDEHLYIPCSSIVGGNSTLPNAMASAMHQIISLSYVLKRVERCEDGRIRCVFDHQNDMRIVHCQKLIFAIPCTLFSSIHIDSKILAPSRLQLFKEVSYGQHGKIIVPVDKEYASHPSLMMEGMGTFLNPEHDVLTLYYVGDYGANLKKQSNESYKKARFLFQKAFSFQHLSSHDPCVVVDSVDHYANIPLVKDWANDPFSRGSYSAFSKDLEGIHDTIVPYKSVNVRKLFAPEQDKIFFAGEHTTIIPEIGTMEAAVESGERTANCVLASIQ